MITHPDKVLFPDEGITKGELAAYYEGVAPVMVPHLRGRPVTLERYPAGIGSKGFWQKNVASGAPEWLERVAVPKKDGMVNYPLIKDTRSLLWATNQNTITHHVWTSRLPDLSRPDICVFDLDPAHDDPAAVRAAALGLRDLLTEIGLVSWVKTSGSKGFHIVVSTGKSMPGVVEQFADAVAALLVRRDPRSLTREFAKADRGGRIYVDIARNGYGATVAAPYTVRARPGAPVSTPCSWDEIARGDVGPRTFTLRNLPARVAELGDLWHDLRRRPRSLARALQILRRLEKPTATAAARRVHR